jgi:SAM-dependent methyltransferase
MATCTIKVNHSFYQEILDASPQAVAQCTNSADAAAYYNLPYQLGKPVGDVLVVGAGAGNDVAAALRNGAASVTAVEIDPAIQYLGVRLHPERPYQDARTIPVLNDARSFLRQTSERFDTIIYGLLDSHTNLGAMTNVRLDSFVYTIEGFREAVDCLKPGGLVVVSYLVMDQTQADKLYGMLREAYPQSSPRVFAAPRGLVFVTGPGLTELPEVIPTAISELTKTYQESAAHVDLATDDWPYFYMQKRTYPVTYALMILVLLGVSAWMVRKNLGGFALGTAHSGVYFFLGAGFMLIETKVITELGLVFGNTWSVSAVAVTGILVMGYLANLCIGRWGAVPRVPAFLLLEVALAAGLLLTRLAMGGHVLPLNKLFLPIALTTPLFFAGLIFSSELGRGGGIGPALAANLFGAMLGGFLEYNSMYWGLSSLYPLGMALYGLAFVCTFWDQGATAAPATGEPGLMTRTERIYADPRESVSSGFYSTGTDSATLSK